MPAIAERLPAKYLVKAEAPKIIASREQHQAYVSSFWNYNARHIGPRKKQKRPNCWSS